jgi:hypothetical protein
MLASSVERIFAVVISEVTFGVPCDCERHPPSKAAAAHATMMIAPFMSAPCS